MCSSDLLKFDIFNLFNLVIISSYVNDTCQLSLIMTDFLLRNLSVKGASLPFVQGFKWTPDFQKYTLKFDLFNLFNPVIISSYVNDICQLSLIMTDFLLRNLSVKGSTLPFVQGFKCTLDFQKYIYFEVWSF